MGLPESLGILAILACATIAGVGTAKHTERLKAQNNQNKIQSHWHELVRASHIVRASVDPSKNRSEVFEEFQANKQYLGNYWPDIFKPEESEDPLYPETSVARTRYQYKEEEARRRIQKIYEHYGATGIPR